MKHENKKTISIIPEHQKLIDEFLIELKTRNCSKHTLRNYEQDIQAFLLWCYRMDFDPLSIDFRCFRAYLAEMTNAKYARTTVNRRLSSLRSFFNYLDAEGVCSNNFASVVQSPKLLKSLPSVIKSNEMDILFDYCNKETLKFKMAYDNFGDCNSFHRANKARCLQKLAQAKRNQAIIQLLYATGARISEISGLSLWNINKQQSVVKLFGKGQKERIVPVYIKAMNDLQEYIEKFRPVLLGQNVSDLCFIANRGGNMSADSIRVMFKKYCYQAGIDPSIHPHSMRHTFATDVLDGGADLRSVQEMLGHASLSTTQIYTHLSPSRLKSVHSQAHPRG